MPADLSLWLDMTRPKNGRGHPHLQTAAELAATVDPADLDGLRPLAPAARLRVSLHAHERMLQRGVGLKDLLLAVLLPDFCDSPPTGKGFRYWRDSVAVVVECHPNCRSVKTVYRRGDADDHAEVT